MTYLIGLESCGINAIIADTRITTDERRGDGANTHMKTFRLFPGCIGGWCGYVQPARQFVTEFKEYAKGIVGTETVWAALEEFVKKYNFRSGSWQQFQILLSINLNRRPTFFVLDSTKESIEPVKLPITLGNGKGVLDEFLNAIILPRMDWPDRRSNPPTAFALVASSLLMGFSQGARAVEMERNGVGGYFYYSYQTASGEFRQEPTLYMLGKYNAKAKMVDAWGYRVAFAENALIVNCPVQNQKMAFIDSAEKPEVSNYSVKEYEEYSRRIMEADKLQPWYTQAACINIDVEQNPIFGLQYPRSEKEWIVQRADGRITPEGESILKQFYTAGRQ